MKLKYKSGMEYQTDSSQYTASCSETKDTLDRDVVQIVYELIGDGTTSDTQVKSVVLELTKFEANTLASVILANSHHPTLKGENAEWMSEPFKLLKDKLLMQNKPVES